MEPPTKDTPEREREDVRYEGGYIEVDKKGERDRDKEGKGAKMQ